MNVVGGSMSFSRRTVEADGVAGVEHFECGDDGCMSNVEEWVDRLARVPELRHESTSLAIRKMQEMEGWAQLRRTVLV
jgi:hypothetical protein